MTRTKRVPIDLMRELDLHEGDVLRVLEVDETSLLFSVDQAGEPGPQPGNVTGWVKSARGSVSLAPGETAEDLRSAFYEAK